MISRTTLKLSFLVAVLALWVAVNNDVFPSPQKLISRWMQTGAPGQNTRKRMPDESKKKAAIENAILKQRRRIIAEECSPHTEHCYSITDVVYRQNNKISAMRMMVLKKIPNYIFTQVDLVTPEKLTWDNHNVRHWPVDKLLVNSEYCQMQIAAGFITEAMTFDSSDVQQVLMIGLGGGVSSNFLSILPEIDIKVETTVVELDPFIVHLAGKYFGHKEVSGLTNVITADGLDYLKEAVAKGAKYRSLLLDACYNYDETRTGVLCPVKEFLSDSTIKNMYDILEDGGVVTVNTISDFDAYNHEAAAMEAFERFFPSCYLAPYQAARNMLVCSKKDNWTWSEQKQRFRENLKNVIDRFDFRSLQYLLQY